MGAAVDEAREAWRQPHQGLQRVGYPRPLGGSGIAPGLGSG